jgi:hypothetical protein
VVLEQMIALPIYQHGKCGVINYQIKNGGDDKHQLELIL